MTNNIKQKLEGILDDSSLEMSPDSYDELVQKLADFVIDTVSKVKKVKKPIDPNAPKRPLTAYLSFSNDNRQSIKDELEKESPGAKILVGDIAKRLGKKWKNLETENPVEFNAYKDKANTLTALYKTELSKYYDSDDYKSFIESEEYIKWTEFADKKKEEKKKAPKKAAKPFVFQPIPEEKLKSVLQLAKNYFLVKYIDTYQNEIDNSDSPLTLALVKKNFSAMIKEHSLVRNKTKHITDNDLFTTETTCMDLFEELSQIKNRFTPPDSDPVEESVSNEDDLITDDEEEEQTGCKHIFDRGNNKNKCCGKTCVEDSDYCRSHNK